MKLVVTGTRGIPDIMGGVETHCEELFPRIADRDVDTTVIRRRSYVRDSLTEWKGVQLVDIDATKEILRSDCPYIPCHQPGEKVEGGCGAYPCHRACAVSAIRQDARHEGGVHASRARL